MKVKYIHHCGDDLTVINAARVSFNKKSKGVESWEIDPNPELRSYNLKILPTEGDIKLIKYLAAHKHISPFGHCFASFHVKAPIFVARQLVKHKFLRWNEISRRYVDDEPEFYKMVWRMKADNKKQGSGPEFSYLEQHWLNMADLDDESHEQESVNLYKWLLKEGVCEEQARVVLPLNMYTEWYWSGSLDAFADMCNLRCKPDAQKETKEVADQLDEIMAELYPVSWAELRKGR